MINFSLYKLLPTIGSAISSVIVSISHKIQQNRDQALINEIGTTLISGGTLHNNLEYILEHTTRKGRLVYNYHYTRTSYSLYDAWNNLVNNSIPVYVVEFIISTGKVKVFEDTTGGNGVASRIEFIKPESGLTVSEESEIFNRYANMSDVSRAFYRNRPEHQQIVAALHLDW